MVNHLTTICIPVASYHTHIVDRAIASAHAQTVPSAVVVYHDSESKGAGHARNRAAANVDTDFITFLDADDELLPTFVERCAMTYQRGLFVYSDWYAVDGSYVDLPDCTSDDGWAKGTRFQLVTTFIPTAFFRHVGMFDESLTALEDVDLYIRFAEAGICGVRCPEALVRYHSRDGQRSRAAVVSGSDERIREGFRHKYNRSLKMGCGCGAQMQPTPDANAQQPGDVLAVALWSGLHTEGSAFSARTYRGGNGSRVWVDRRDVQARPRLWALAYDPLASSPAIDDVRARALAALAERA